MGKRRLWSRGLRGHGIAFALVLLVPASAAIYLALELIREDRELVLRRGNERRENAAELFVTALEQALVATERKLATGSTLPVTDTKSGTFAVSWRRAESDDSAVDFEDGERLELVEGDLEAAASEYKRLAQSDRQAIRAGGLLRLARVERKRQRIDAALAVYRDLALVDSIVIAGVPADLMGRRAACEVLEVSGRTTALRSMAQALHDDLVRLRWPVDPDTWRLYLRQTARWLGRPTSAAEDGGDVLTFLLGEWTASNPSIRSGRKLLVPHGVPILLLWNSGGRHMTALVADSAFQTEYWLAPAARALRERSVRAVLATPDGRRIWGDSVGSAAPTAGLTAETTGLPWSILVADEEAADRDELAPRHRTLIVGLAAVIILVAGGGYLVARAVSRELQVAALQSDFVSAVSHEFRTPLTSLKQFTDLLTSEDEPSAVERRAFHAAQGRATERLRRLVETLLDFGRMEAGARPYQLATIRIADVVSRTVESFRQDALPSGFSLVDELPDEESSSHLVVAADRDAIGLALWNLLDNAVKYSGHGREIRVTVEAASSWVVVGVHDKGPGIPASERLDLFGKFVRGASSHFTNIPGTGLGLAMVKHIVDGHHGKVRIDSVLGRGSTFFIELPTCPTF